MPGLTAASEERLTARLRAGAEDVLFWFRAAIWSRVSDRFDRQRRTDTGGVLSLERLGIRHPKARFGVRYQPIDPWTFGRALRALPQSLDMGQFTFVDLGCGKGRALLLASEFGFKNLVGVELSAVLAERARANLRKANVTNACVVGQEASEFTFPAGDLVVYLFNPFVGTVFCRTIEHLCASATGDVYLIYVNPVEEHLLYRRCCFVRSRSEGVFVIYQHRWHGARIQSEVKS